MASGLLSLAYIAELAVVFNLAYAELEKDRYLKRSNEKIDKIRTQIDNSNHEAIVSSNLQRFASLINQVKNLQSEDVTQRCAAWHITITKNKVDQPKYFGWHARFYSFFAKQKDKTLAYVFIVATVVIVFLSTIFSYKEDIITDYYCVTWISFFSLLTISLVYPIFIIHVGRSMQQNLALIVEEVNQSFEASVTKLIDDVLNPPT